MKNWANEVKLGITPEQGLELINDRSNGNFTYDLEPTTGVVTSFELEGEFCNEELEGAMAWLLPRAANKMLVGDYLPHAGEVADLIHPERYRPEFTIVNQRHGISAHHASALIHSTQTTMVEIGMSASKGGRVWIDRCRTLAELQALLVRLNYYCAVRNYEVTTAASMFSSED